MSTPVPSTGELNFTHLVGAFGGTQPHSMSEYRISASGSVAMSSFRGRKQGISNLPTGARIYYNAETLTYAGGATVLSWANAYPVTIPATNAANCVAITLTPPVTVNQPVFRTPAATGGFDYVEFAAGASNNGDLMTGSKQINLKFAYSVGFTWMGLINLQDFNITREEFIFRWFVNTGLAFTGLDVFEVHTTGNAVQCIFYYATQHKVVIPSNALANKRRRWNLIVCRQNKTSNKLEAFVNNLDGAAPDATGTTVYTGVGKDLTASAAQMSEVRINSLNNFNANVKASMFALYDRSITNAELAAIKLPINILDTNV